MPTYNPKDIFVSQRNLAGTNFEEKVLTAVSNSFICFDSNLNLTSSVNLPVPTTIDTASYLKSGANIYLNNSYIYSNTSASAPSSPIEGRIWWDKTSHTYVIDELNTNLQIGQKNYIRAIAGEFIPSGKIVYINGSNTDPDNPLTKLPIVYLALADGNGIKSNVIGISAQDIPVGTRGFIITQGIVNGVDTGLFFDGDTLYLSSTNSGSYTNEFPVDPFEKINIGINLYSDAANGRILVNISTLPTLTNPYVGILSVPSFTDYGNNTFSVGSTQANFCTSADGIGEIKTYTIPSSSFTISVGTTSQYILANYNSGSPYYLLSTNKSLIDEIQTIPVFSIIEPAPTGIISYVDWDSPGTLLPNKLHQKTIAIDGIKRAEGLILGTSGSYITITSGSAWWGVKQKILSSVNTFNSSSNPGSLLYHSASVWVANPNVPTFINNIYDDGVNTYPLSTGSYVINYIYRGIGATNRTLIILSNQYSKLSEADIAPVPVPPDYFNSFALLIGRIIVQSGSSVPEMVNSIFNTTFSPTRPPYHNDLLSIQGGISGEYYHVNSSSYSKIQAGSLDTASYLNSGATLYLSQSYIESNTSSIQPPWKPGRMWWDKVNHTYAIYNDNSQVALQVGQELLIHAVGGELINNGSVVYVSGSISDANNPSTNTLPIIYNAIADGTHLKSNAIGLATVNFSSGSTGWITIAGIVHGLNTSEFNNGDLLWLNPSISGYYTNVKPSDPYETIQVGYCLNSGITNGDILVDINIVPPTPLAYAGITTDVVLTNNNNGTITVSSGSVNLYNNVMGNGSITGYPLQASTLSVITGSTNYIVAQYSSSAASYAITTDETFNNGTTIVRVANIDVNFKSSGSWELHTWNVGIVGSALANKTNNKDIHLYGYQRESGLTLYTTGSSTNFGITSGTVWYGPNSQILGDFLSFNSSSCDTYRYISSASIWSYSTTPGFDNTHYNNTGGLANLAPNSWSANFVYRIASPDSPDVAIVLANQQFTDMATAVNNAQPPSNLPNIIRDLSLLVGMIVVQSGSSNTNVQSSFSTLFAPATVTQHNSLLGLQGGQGGEFYHLTLADFTGTGTGSMVRQSNATMSNIMFPGSTPYHVPYWKSDHTLTYTGSVQVYLDKYVLINSSSIDPTNPEALLVLQKNSGSRNTIGAYATVNDFSQIYNQNLATHASASTDLVATNDIGTQTSHYIDIGIGSSVYNDPRWPWLKPNDGYIEIDGGDLWISTLTNNSIRFIVNNSSQSGYIDGTGFHITASVIGTSSWANNSITASTSSTSNTASYITSSKVIGLIPTSSFSITSSYSIGISPIKSGVVSGSSFGGIPQTSSISFSRSFVDNTYSITVVGESSRTWTIQNKLPSGFTINSNNNTTPTGMVFWQAIYQGEYY